MYSSLLPNGVGAAVLVSLFLVIPALAHVNHPSSTCTGNSSYPCLSNKLIKVFRRIYNTPEIPITEWMSLVPTADASSDGKMRSLELPEADRKFRRQGLFVVLGDAIDDFIESRSVRLALPTWATGSQHAVDLDVGRAFSQVTGRKKKDKGMGMGAVVMMMMGKMMMMSMGMVKMKAMKALMVGTIALVLSKVQLFKMLMSKKDEGESKHIIVIASDHGGGGGGGGHSGGGGGGGHGGGGGSVHIVESYGPPSSGAGGGWSGGGGGGGDYHGGGSSGGSGDSWGGGGSSGWTSGGGSSHGGGGGGGGYSYGPASGGHSGGGGGGGWGKRAYFYDSYNNVATPTSNSTTQ